MGSLDGPQQPIGLPPILGHQPAPFSFRSRWAARTLVQDFADFQTTAFKVKADKGHLLPIASAPTKAVDGVADVPSYSVGIVGAGVAGMFTALIFDYLNDNFGLNVTYEVIEAVDEDNVGGRLYTYNFPNKDGQPPVGPHDYYDVGAMRFPDSMERTFQLFTNVLTMNYVPDPKTNPPSPGDLIPYYFQGLNQPVLYNGIQVVQQPVTKNGVTTYQPPLSAQTFNVPLPASVETTDAGDLVTNALTDIANIYKNQGEEAFWDALKKDVDPYSARQYLFNQEAYDYDTIEFMETVDFGNGWYDQAASEMVLESLDFGGDGKWWCVEGGVTQVAKKMKDTIKAKNPNAFQWGQLVTEIGYTAGSNQTKIDVTWQDEKTGVAAPTKTYDAVFNSATLGSMKYMKLENLNLNWGSKQAIRNLGYGASCKVGVRFNTMWWMENGLNITSGGVAKSDLPIQFCVYPSYNINDDPSKPGVLLVSYTWAREAERFGALINRGSPENEAQLRALITHNLALLHAKSGDTADYERLYKIIDSNWLDHYAYNWYENPRMAGAFAFFAPQQFTNLYNDIIASDGRYMMIGEATSAHHAWVLGALESAVRGVYQFLYQAQSNPNAVPAQKAYAAYNDKTIPGPYGPLPVEMNLPPGVKIPVDAPKSLVSEVNPVGELTRIGVLLEQIRLKYNLDEFEPEKATKDDLAPFWELLPDDFKVQA